MPYRLRSQSSSSFVEGTIKHEAWYKSVCTGAASWNTSLVLAPSTYEIGTKSVMLDYVTEKFFKRSKAGEIIINPMRRASVLISGAGTSVGVSEGTTVQCALDGPYKMQFRRSCNGVPAGLITSGFVFPDMSTSVPPPNGGVLPDSARRDLLTEVATSTMNKRGRSKAGNNLWETLAELDKLAGLIPGLASAATAVVSKHNHNAVKRRSRGGADAWMATHYGVMPIISDISAIVKGMQDAIGTRIDTSRSQGSIAATKSYSGSGLWLPYNNVSPHGFNYTNTETENFSVRCTSIDSLEAGMLYNIGFSTKGLLTLPWELANKSFVVDWFVNIGDFLGAIIPAFGNHNMGSCHVIKKTILKVHTIQGTYSAIPSSYTELTGPSGSATYEHTYTERIKGLPKVGIVIKSDFRLDNVMRAADAISLLVQVLRKS